MFFKLISRESSSIPLLRLEINFSTLIRFQISFEKYAKILKLIAWIINKTVKIIIPIKILPPLEMQADQAASHDGDKPENDQTLVKIFFGTQQISKFIIEKHVTVPKKDIEPVICMEEKKAGEISPEEGGDNFFTHEKAMPTEKRTRAKPREIDPAPEARIVKRNNIYENFFD